jgi:hypothetical protein
LVFKGNNSFMSCDTEYKLTVYAKDKKDLQNLTEYCKMKKDRWDFWQVGGRSADELLRREINVLVITEVHPHDVGVRLCDD